MRKILALFLCAITIFSFTACKNPQPKDINCAEIITAYDKAGYSNIYHLHSDDDYQISGGEKCYIIIHETENDDSDLAEIKIFSSEEAAKETADLDNYNVARWMVAAMLGEGRWLKSGRYGTIVYSSYSSKLLNPLKELM